MDRGCFGCTIRAELQQLQKKYESENAYVKLEKEIHSLEYRLSKSIKETEKYHDCWVKTKDKLRSVEHDLALSTLNEEQQKAVIEGKDAEIARLNYVIEDLRGQILKLGAQINRDYTNSSIPSSKDENHKTIANSRVKTGRKPGGQPGHKGSRLKPLTPTQPPVYLPVPDSIANSSEYYKTGRQIRKQLIDVTISVSVTEYCAAEYRSRLTGTRWHPEFPANVKNPVNYGSSIKALAFLLNNYCNVSIEKVRTLLKEISNSSICLSKGMLNHLSKEFSAKTADDRNKIYAMLAASPVMYSDATVGRINGKNNAVIICNNENGALYFPKESKGFLGLKGTPVEDYKFAIVHDHDRTYYNFGNAHQECLAHVLRYLQDSIDNEKSLSWNSKMKEHISYAIHASKTGLTKDADIIDCIEREYDTILELAEAEYTANPPSKYYRDGFNLYKRLKEYKDSHLYFLHHPEVGYTNNLSERNLRSYKRKQKQAVSFRSNEGQLYFCDSLGVLKTAQMNGNNIFQAAKNAFAR